MAISISSFTRSASNTTSPKTVSTTWHKGDIVVVCAQAENNTANITTPTATGLNFGSNEVSLGPPGNATDTGPMMEVWVSDPAALGGTQNISVSESVGGKNWEFVRWVITGGPLHFNTTSSVTEAAFSFTSETDGIVLYAFNDWNNSAADQTISTGSGTPTERFDGQGAAGYSAFYGDWVGTDGTTQSYGVTSYTGLSVAHFVTSFAPGGDTGLEDIRPDGDVTRVGWVNEGGGTTDIWTSIDEATASDSDYVTVTV